MCPHDGARGTSSAPSPTPRNPSPTPPHPSPPATATPPQPSNTFTAAATTLTAAAACVTPTANATPRTDTNHSAHPRETSTRLSPQSILVIAQSITHLPPVSDTAAKILTPDAEYRLRQIVQDALKFARHSKRTRLLPTDVNAALRLRNADPVYGFSKSSPHAAANHDVQPAMYARYPATVPSVPPHPPTPQRGAASGGGAVSATSAQSPTNSARASVPPPPTLPPLSAANSQPQTTAPPSASSAPPDEAPTSNAAPQTAPSTTSSAAAAAPDTQASPSPPAQVAPAVPLAVVSPVAMPTDTTIFSDVPGVPNLFFAHEKKYVLSDVIKTSLPPVPLEVVVTAHWLAVDSKQPKIPQNPVDVSKDVAVNSSAQIDGAATAKVDDPQTELSSSTRLTRSPAKERHRKRKRDDSANPQTVVKPRIKHVLSRELQLYFDYLQRVLFQYESEPIGEVLSSVATEHGIVQLVPYLTFFVEKMVRNHMRDLPLLFSLMRLVNAMNNNSVFPLETYLHQLLPSVMTCLVGKKLCEKARHNHWALRDFVAVLLRRICDRFEDQYAVLKPRMTITLGEALDMVKRPLTTHYGAIVGFTALGRLPVQEGLMPRVAVFANKVRTVFESDGTSAMGRFQAAKVYCALAKAVVVAKGEEGEGVVVAPAIVGDVMAGAERLLPALHAEYGDKVYPLGEKAMSNKVAEEILALVKKNESAS